MRALRLVGLERLFGGEGLQKGEELRVGAALCGEEHGRLTERRGEAPPGVLVNARDRLLRGERTAAEEGNGEKQRALTLFDEDVKALLPALDALDPKVPAKRK